MITIKDIAKKAGVAPATVSYSLNNDLRIPEDTRVKILKLASELGYTGRSGKKMNVNYKKHIVICMHSISGDVYPPLVESLNAVLKHSSCETLIYLGDEIDNLRWMDGLIVLNSAVTRASIESVLSRRIPIVLMDRCEDIDGVFSVTLDNFNGMYNVTQRVIDKGCKSFIFVSGPSTSYESKERYEGFNKAVNDNRLNPKRVMQLHSDFTKEGGENTARYLLGIDSLPDAIICANDEMAKGIADVLTAHGLDIPQSVKIAGFDGSIPDACPGFVTAKANHKDWGSHAGYTILRSLERNNNVTHITMPVELIETA